MLEYIRLEDFKINIKTQYEPAPGRLLIAEPLLRGDVFSRSTVYLMSHNYEGSFGFITNKLSSYTIEDILSDFRHLDIPVFEGGPVQSDALFAVHQYHDILGGELFTNNVCIGANFEKLHDMLMNKTLSMHKIKFFMGYSGWAHNQLDAEIEKNTWMVHKNGLPYLFNYNTQENWKQSIADLGEKYSYLSNFPLHPENN